MMLVDEGKVRVDDAVETFLPEFEDQWLIVEQDEAHQCQQAGTSYHRAQYSRTHQRAAVYVRHGRATLDRLPLCDAVRSYAMTPLQYAPDSQYQYSNAGINTAGRIIEVVSGISYEEFLETRLFAPLGMTNPTFRPTTEQLARLAKSYKPTVDNTALEETPISCLQHPLIPPPATDPRRRPVLYGLRPRAFLPDDPQWRHPRRQTLLIGSRHPDHDEQTNRRSHHRRLRPGLGHR